MLKYFYEAFFAGLAMSAIFGPLTLLFVRKILDMGAKGGLAVGLGILLGDSIYGFIGGAGLTFISHFLIQKAAIFKIIGGLLLIYLAIDEFRQKEKLKTEPSVRNGTDFIKLSLQSCLLTLANPITIIGFISIFASLGDEGFGVKQAIWIMLGLFVGGGLWLSGLGILVLSIKDRLSIHWLNRMRYLSAPILSGFGIWAIIGGLKHYCSY